MKINIGRTETSKRTLSDTLNDYKLDKSIARHTLRQIDFDWEKEKFEQQFQTTLGKTNVSKQYINQIEDLITDVADMDKKMLKIQLERTEIAIKEIQRLKDGEEIDLKEKNFLLQEYLKTIEFLNDEIKQKSGILKTTSGIIGDLAEEYLDLRGMYSAVFENDPFFMGIYNFASKGLGAFRKHRQDKKNLRENDEKNLVISKRKDEIEKEKNQFSTASNDAENSKPFVVTRKQSLFEKEPTTTQTEDYSNSRNDDLADSIRIQSQEKLAYRAEELDRKNDAEWQDKVLVRLASIDETLKDANFGTGEDGDYGIMSTGMLSTMATVAVGTVAATLAGGGGYLLGDEINSLIEDKLFDNNNSIGGKLFEIFNENVKTKKDKEDYRKLGIDETTLAVSGYSISKLTNSGIVDDSFFGDWEVNDWDRLKKAKTIELKSLYAAKKLSEEDQAKLREIILQKIEEDKEFARENIKRAKEGKPLLQQKDELQLDDNTPGIASAVATGTGVLATGTIMGKAIAKPIVKAKESRKITKAQKIIDSGKASPRKIAKAEKISTIVEKGGKGAKIIGKAANLVENAPEIAKTLVDDGLAKTATKTGEYASKGVDAVKSSKIVGKGTKVAGKVLSKAAIPLTGALSAYDEYQEGGSVASAVASGAGAMGGAMTGASLGALAGSVVPVVGTAIGGFIGGVGGALLGEEAMSAMFGDSEDEKKRNLIFRDLIDKKVIETEIGTDKIDRSKVKKLSIKELASLLYLADLSEEDSEFVQKELIKKKTESGINLTIEDKRKIKITKTGSIAIEDNSKKENENILQKLIENGILDEDMFFDNELNIDKNALVDLKVSELQALLSDQARLDDEDKMAVQEALDKKLEPYSKKKPSTQNVKKTIQKLIENGILDEDMFFDNELNIDKNALVDLKVSELQALLSDQARLDDEDRLMVKDVLNKKILSSKNAVTLDKAESTIKHINTRINIPPTITPKKELPIKTIKAAKQIISNTPDVGDYKPGLMAAIEESGGMGAAAISNPSKGFDPGGKSYGTFQLSSKTGTLNEYLKQSKYAKEFEGLKPTSPEFDKKWKELAKKDPGFADDQYDFIKKTHYDPVIKKLQKKGIDLSKRGKSIQEALFANGVQHGAGGASRWIGKALEGKDINKMTDAELIQTMYDYKYQNIDTLFKSSNSRGKDAQRKRAMRDKKNFLALANSKNNNIENLAQTLQPIKNEQNIPIVPTSDQQEQITQIETSTSQIEIAKQEIANPTNVPPQQQANFDPAHGSGTARQGESPNTSTAMNDKSTIQRITDRYFYQGMA